VRWEKQLGLNSQLATKNGGQSKMGSARKFALRLILKQASNITLPANLERMHVLLH
jgi:hypothetical protein